MNDLLLKDEVYAVVGAAIEVHKELGPGFLEPIYQEAMQMELEKRLIPFEPQQPMAVQYKGQTLSKGYVVDIVCFGSLIVELKAQEKLSGKEEAQVLNYLKASRLKVGLLINFGSYDKLEWKRFVM